MRPNCTIVGTVVARPEKREELFNILSSFVAPTRAEPGNVNYALLVTALKRGSLYRIPLSPDGQTVSGPIERNFQTDNRYRDTAISPDGRTIYIATDPGGWHETVAGGIGDKVANLALFWRSRTTATEGT